MGAPYIYDISRLSVKIKQCKKSSLQNQRVHFEVSVCWSARLNLPSWGWNFSQCWYCRLKSLGCYGLSVVVSEFSEVNIAFIFSFQCQGSKNSGFSTVLISRQNNTLVTV